MSPRRRLVLTVSLAVLAAWILALAGVALSRALRATPDRIVRLIQSPSWNSLAAADRSRRLREVARLLNRLSPEDRRIVRMNPAFAAWFRGLEDPEKGEFLELTVPAGFSQMLAAFEEMPQDRRRRAVAESVRRLREARERLESEGPGPGSDATNRAPELSPELQEKMVTLGLKSFYETGSPDLKAELAPVVGELQRAMESGRGFRMRPGPP
ncbi:MAG: hypothetical protein U1G08_03810 [Verrucomicrobiota bacterium]